jgi:hypothetical protein
MTHFSFLAGHPLLRLAIWIVGLPIIAFQVRRMIRQVRAIHALDARVRAEEESNTAVQNPYAQMAQMVGVQVQRDGADREPPRGSDPR